MYNTISELKFCRYWQGDFINRINQQCRKAIKILMAVVIGVICVVLSLLICFAVTPLFNQSISQKTEMVRVTQPIKTGEVITKDMMHTPLGQIILAIIIYEIIKVSRRVMVVLP